MNKVFMTIFALFMVAVFSSFHGAEAHAEVNSEQIEMSFVDVTDQAPMIADNKPIGIAVKQAVGEAFVITGGDNNEYFANAIIPSRINQTRFEGHVFHLNDDPLLLLKINTKPAFYRRE